MAANMGIAPMKPGTGRQVLVVEEQMMPMLLAEEVLLAEGYRVATAANFHGATRAMTTCDDEAVVLDLHLADSSSLLLADEFIELGIPMLFASTRTEARLPDRFGDALILHKPYLPEELLVGVSTLFMQRSKQGPTTPAVNETSCR